MTGPLRPTVSSHLKSSAPQLLGSEGRGEAVQGLWNLRTQTLGTGVDIPGLSTNASPYCTHRTGFGKNAVVDITKGVENVKHDGKFKTIH